MAVELKPGSASAAAHAEAGAKAVDFVKDFVRETGAGGGGGEDSPSPAAEPPADPPDPEPGEGTSPEPVAPAVPPKDTEDEDLADDYDEEEVAEPAPTDTDDEPQPAVSAQPTDADKTWSQYKTEGERKKALHENKAYGIRMANEAKALREENDRLKSGKPAGAEPAPPASPAAPPPAAETIETVLGRLVQTDPEVAKAVSALQTQREQIVGRIKAIDELKASIDTQETAVTKAKHVLEYFEEQAKADPDNYQLVDAIKAKQAEIARMETSVNSAAIRLGRLEMENGTLQDRYRNDLQSVRERAVSEAGRSEAKVREDAQFKADYERSGKEWDAALPKVFEKFKITNPKIQKKAERMLLKSAAVEVARTGEDIPDLAAWMLEQGADINELIEEIRGEAVATYGNRKKADAEQPAPKGSAAVATPEQRAARSSREADRIAGRVLKEHLSGARR